MTTKTSAKEVQSKDLLDYIKDKIKQGNARKLVIRKSNGDQVLEIPLTAGVGLGGLLLIKAPIIVALSALAVWSASFKVEVHPKDEAGKQAEVEQLEKQQEHRPD